MPTTRRRKARAARHLKPHELAFLTGDDSKIIPGTREAARLITMRNDPDGRLMYGDRTARQLLEEFPEYRGNHADKP